MPPRFTTFTNNGESSETSTELCPKKQISDDSQAKDITQFNSAKNPKVVLVWRNIILFAYLHLAALYGGYLFFTKAKWATVFFSIFLYVIGVFGITAGAHRLWSHRSYKAKWPLRLLLIICNTTAFEDDVYHWVRDHRLHHKFSETDADPHNNNRGFFFAHIGWLLCKKHPDVLAKGKTLDLSDIKADPIVMFQRKYYMLLMPLACFILPTIIPMYFWNETLTNSWFVPVMFRWCLILNATWGVNSLAHRFGARSYDKNIKPSENPIVSVVSFGEGWHNYHHVFPWDYKTAEWGNYSKNLTTAFIDFFAKIGWAYELKSVLPEFIKKRVKRTGDGTHELWGYGDKNITLEEQDSIIILNKKQN